LADKWVLLPGLGVKVKMIDLGDGTYAIACSTTFSGDVEVDTDALEALVSDMLEKQDTLIAKDFATQTTLASVLAKIIAAPATEAKQDTLIAKDFATQTTLASVLAKIIAAPATEAKQDTLIAKDFATQTTLASTLDSLGAKADAAATAGDTTPFSIIALLKGIWVKLAGTLTVALSGVITPTHTAVTAGATTTAALAVNANRKYALLVNDSDEVIYIKLGAAAVLNEGIRLNANGGSYEMSNSIGNLTTGAINCISTSGGKILLATEGV